MVIDIISYTNEQFAALSEEQILEVKKAQLQKNKLLQRLEENKRKEKFRLIEAGIYRSKIYESLCQAYQAQYEQDVENLRDSLIFYLRFAAKVESSSDAPYTVDYALSYDERYEIVKAYYDKTYATAVERYNAFLKDEYAPAYLGEQYAVLFDYYAVRAGV